LRRIDHTGNRGESQGPQRGTERVYIQLLKKSHRGKQFSETRSIMASIRRGGHDLMVAVVASARDFDISGPEEITRQPITVQEVEEASSILFRPTGTPSEVEFHPISPSLPPPRGLTPARLRGHQLLEREMVAFGGRLAMDPRVQAAVYDNLQSHGEDERFGDRLNRRRPLLVGPPSADSGMGICFSSETEGRVRR
ncbi:unnamed protein product, partial [Discosporangium mesarthrocarpum]